MFIERNLVKHLKNRIVAIEEIQKKKNTKKMKEINENRKRKGKERISGKRNDPRNSSSVKTFKKINFFRRSRRPR